MCYISHISYIQDYRLYYIIHTYTVLYLVYFRIFRKCIIYDKHPFWYPKVKKAKLVSSTAKCLPNSNSICFSVRRICITTLFDHLSFCVKNS